MDAIIIVIMSLPSIVTINRPDVVELIDTAARKLTGGNKTAVVALALSRLLDQEARQGSLYGAHPGSLRARPGVDLTAPVLADPVDAETRPADPRRRPARRP